MALDKVYRKSGQVITRAILDETLLVPIRGRLTDMQRIFALNPVARHIWSQLDGVRSLAVVRDGIVAKFDVEPAQAEADLSEFIEWLESESMIGQVP
jgi:hypothetical protein